MNLLWKGEISNFTGISDTYEEPLNPKVVVETGHLSLEDYCRRSRDAVTKLEMISTTNSNCQNSLQAPVGSGSQA